MAEQIVELRNANIYQGESLILQEVSIAVGRGEFVYLVGKTGTGKSSLLKTLYGDLTLREGEGTVVGYNLKSLDWKKLPYLRRNLGVVFQEFQLLTDRNVNGNLKFVLKATGWKDERLMDEKIADVLDKVGLKTKGFKMPFELSGGEQQRVVLARALVAKPSVLLADEPTGNLDFRTGEMIFELLSELHRSHNLTSIFCTHNLAFARRCSRVLCMDKGGLVPGLGEDIPQPGGSPGYL